MRLTNPCRKSLRWLPMSCSILMYSPSQSGGKSSARSPQSRALEYLLQWYQGEVLPNYLFHVLTLEGNGLNHSADYIPPRLRAD